MKKFKLKVESLDQPDRKVDLLYIVGVKVPLQTFVQRELLEILRDKNLNARVISFRKGDEGIPLPPELRSKILYSSNPGRLRLFMSNVFVLLRSPVKYLELVRLILFGKHNNLALKIADLRTLLFGASLSNEIRNLGIDHIHAHWANRPSTIALILSKFLDVPFSFTTHSSDLFVHPVLLKEKISAAKAVVTCADFNRNYLVNSVSPASREKIFTVYHGIDFRTFRFRRKKINDVPVVLAVGRLAPTKGFSYLIGALGLVKEHGGKFRAVIIGEGSEFETLKSKIREKNLVGNIELLGALPFKKVKKYFEEADIFAAPSVMIPGKDFDKVPNVLIEAMASRTPIVATRISGIPEAVKDGENGLLVEEKDAKALSEAIQVLLNDRKLRRKFGEAGYRKALRMFDIEKNVKHLKQVILKGAVVK